MVDNAGAARASRTTANCYLVHAPGTYKIPLVYGNAIKNGDETSTAAFYTTQTSNTLQRLVNHADAGITTPWIKTQLGACPDGAQLVWEDVKGMISSVGIDTSGNGFLTFTVDPDKIGEGNAVIAATLSGTIVWSWHVWVTNETLSNLTSINTGSHTYQVAPVNVGQVNGTIKAGATIYAGELCQVRATVNGVTEEFQVSAKDYVTGGTAYYNPSPYYQWGRKDPMYPVIGGYNSIGTRITDYIGTTIISTTSATPGATIQHPDFWYYNESNSGPYGTGTAYAGKRNYWDAENITLDNSNSTSRAVATVKTVYDPCPPDFCVPTSNLYKYIYSNYSSYFPWTSSPLGRTWNKDGAYLFFPANGRRHIYANLIYDNNATYWAATPSDGWYARVLNFTQNNVYFELYSKRSCGFSIRAVAEE